MPFIKRRKRALMSKLCVAVSLLCAFDRSEECIKVKLHALLRVDEKMFSRCCHLCLINTTTSLPCVDCLFTRSI